MAPRKKSTAVVRTSDTLDQLRAEHRAVLGDLLPGDQFAMVRETLRATGTAKYENKQVYALTKPISGSDDVEVMHLAVVNRDPGLSESYLDLIQDFRTAERSRATFVDFLWNIYRNEGLVNNAISKVASVISGGGRFKVRSAKRGKVRKAKEQLEEVLYQWQRDVNNAPADGIITTQRGLKSLTKQGVMYALIEGSWFGRQTWQQHEIAGLGTFDLPMVIQTLTTGQLEPIRQLRGWGRDEYEWSPPAELLSQMRNPVDSETRKLIQRMFDKDVLNILKKKQKVRLDPALLLHIKYKGRETEPFGESMIQPAISSIAYRRAVEQLDLVTMQSLVNRIVIIQIGSDDPNSPYSKTDLMQARTRLMQSMTDDPGPNMLMVWAGWDVKIEQVGAHNTVLDLSKSHAIAEQKVKLALGVPDALLTGTNQGSKASGWAALLGTSAHLDGLASQFAVTWQSLGERIAVENGFEDIDLAYEWDQSLLLDRTEEQNQTRLDYQLGLVSIKTLIESRGRNYEAERAQRAKERGLELTATDEEIFAAPMPPGGGGLDNGTGGQGRPPKNQTGNPNPDRPPTNTPQENK